MSRIHCTNCGVVVAADDMFCHDCGAEAAPAHEFCTGCAAVQPRGSSFCGLCGTHAGEPAWPLRRPALVAATPAQFEAQPQPQPQPQPRQTRRPWLVAGIAAACALIVISAGVGTYLLAGGTGQPAAVTLEPVGFSRPTDFVGNLDTDLEDGRRIAQAAGSARFEVVDDPRTSRTTTALSGQAADGNAPGLYGGSRDTQACDVEELVEELTDDADAGRAQAWADVHDIRVSEIPEYVDGLTAARLSFDTRVTNHALSDGQASAFQSLSQAGTAVLVDETGIPRVNCNCGNPLLEPAELSEDSDEEEALAVEDLASNPDQAWEGLDPERVVAVQPASTPVEAITLLDSENDDGLLERPVGSNGTEVRDTGTGDVKVTLEWQSDADLDLHVTEPDGTQISYQDRGPTSTGGELDVDANIGCEPNGSLENVFWPPGAAPSGDFLVVVNGYSVDGCGSGDFTLTIQVAGQEPQVHQGSVGEGQDAVFDFSSAEQMAEPVEPEPEEEAPPVEPEKTDNGLSADSTITTQGLGPVLAGMTVEEAQAAAGGTGLVSQGQAPGDCEYYDAEGLSGVSFMVMDGVIARVDVREPTVATESGVRVGDSEAVVDDAYGERIQRTPNEVAFDWTDLTFLPEDSEDETRIVFGVDSSDVVAQITAGRLPEVAWPEGCL